MQSLVRRYADATPTPWANGAGTTTPLLSSEEAARFVPELPAWRLSVAALERPASFSPLPGIARRFMPVGGDVVLAIDGRRVPVAERTVCAFDGGADVSLLELSAPCHAVNLMIEGGAEYDSAPVLRCVPAGQALPEGSLLAVLLEPGGGFERFDLVRPVAGSPALAVACAVIEASTLSDGG